MKEKKIDLVRNESVDLIVNGHSHVRITNINGTIVVSGFGWYEYYDFEDNIRPKQIHESDKRK